MKSRKNRNLKSDCSEVTFKSIGRWYQEMFEQLGWMVLAKEKGMTYKIAPYKMTLQKLKCSILKRHSSMYDVDKKKDLEIMLHNVEILIKHVNKDF